MSYTKNLWSINYTCGLDLIVNYIHFPPPNFGNVFGYGPFLLVHTVRVTDKFYAFHDGSRVRKEDMEFCHNYVDTFMVSSFGVGGFFDDYSEACQALKEHITSVLNSLRILQAELTSAHDELKGNATFAEFTSIGDYVGRYAAAE